MISHHVVRTIELEKKNAPVRMEFSTLAARRKVCDVAGYYRLVADFNRSTLKIADPSWGNNKEEAVPAHPDVVSVSFRDKLLQFRKSPAARF